MKFIIFALIIVGFFAFIFGVVLYSQVKISGEPIAVPNTVPVTPTSTTATGTIFVPPDFHGPTADPHIIGPSSNPPNH